MAKKETTEKTVKTISKKKVEKQPSVPETTAEIADIVADDTQSENNAAQEELNVKNVEDVKADEKVEEPQPEVKQIETPVVTPSNPKLTKERIRLAGYAWNGQYID